MLKKMIKIYGLAYYKFRQSAALFCFVHISKLRSNFFAQQIFSKSYDSNIFLKSLRHFYRNLLAEMLTVYSSLQNLQGFLQCIIGL